MKNRLTAENIKAEVLKILADYNLTLEQVFTCTVDNGANMLKAIDLFEEDLETFDNIDQLEIELNEEEEGDIIYIDAVDCNTVSCMRCAAHTLQLAANELLKNRVFARMIRIIRDICKLCRNTQYRYFFNQEQIPYPKLDVKTRWGTTYIMMKSLQNNETFWKRLGDIHEDLKLSDNDWIFLNKYVEAFEPVYKTTLKLQEENLLIGLHFLYSVSYYNRERF